MGLILTIENETRLPDGGPLSVRLAGGRGLDIGRDQHLDWTLPDPSRVISGRHCEIRFRDGAYWLTDVSVNGTYVNGADHRVQSPYRLQNGDRLEIGQYIIAVVIDDAGQPAATPLPPTAPPGGAGLWDTLGGEAPPIPRRDLRPPQELRPVHAGFIDWAVDMPSPGGTPAAAPVPPSSRPDVPADDYAWAPHRPAPLPVPEPPPPIPTPRRPAGSAGIAPPAADPWNDPPAAAAHGFQPPPWEAPPSAPPAPTPGVPGSQPLPMPSSIVPMAAPPLPPSSAGADEVIRRFARGAGLPEHVVAGQDAGQLAERLGVLMRLVAGELKTLLAARAESKRIARSVNQTMMQVADNNPLKFSPTVDDALRLLFGPAVPGYLDAARAFDESFKDLKAHQVKTYSAMQHALRMLVEDLDPQSVSEVVEADRGLGALVGSRKARLWDTYVARWEAKTAPYEDGLVDAFMLYFAECYDRGGRGPG